jgi:hypothetical protein
MGEGFHGMLHEISHMLLRFDAKHLQQYQLSNQ